VLFTDIGHHQRTDRRIRQCRSRSGELVHNSTVFWQEAMGLARRVMNL
jgi:hypothetical protein